VQTPVWVGGGWGWAKKVGQGLSTWTLKLPTEAAKTIQAQAAITCSAQDQHQLQTENAFETPLSPCVQIQISKKNLHFTTNPTPGQKQAGAGLISSNVASPL